MSENKNIGIFWIYENDIFFETQSLKDINPINGFKDSDLSHYQAWDKIKNIHSKLYLHEYEDVPRGRIVFNIDELKFIVYCNKNILSSNQSKQLILKAFKLKKYSGVDFIEDEHYEILI